MSLFYGLICLLLTIGWMINGTQEWIVIAVCFAGLQITSELVSAVAGYWIAKKKILDDARESQNSQNAVLYGTDRKET